MQPLAGIRLTEWQHFKHQQQHLLPDNGRKKERSAAKRGTGRRAGLATKVRQSYNRPAGGAASL